MDTCINSAAFMAIYSSNLRYSHRFACGPGVERRSLSLWVRLFVCLQVRRSCRWAPVSRCAWCSRATVRRWKTVSTGGHFHPTLCFSCFARDSVGYRLALMSSGLVSYCHISCLMYLSLCIVSMFVIPSLILYFVLSLGLYLAPIIILHLVSYTTLILLFIL